MLCSDMICVLFICSCNWLCSFMVEVVFVVWFGIDIDFVGFVFDVDVWFLVE